MAAVERAIGCNAGGRRRPGRSGDPKAKAAARSSRPRGLAGLLAEGEAELAVRRLVDRALAGDVGLARLLLERLEPRPRGRKLPFELPPGADIEAVRQATLAAVAAGEISPAEALRIARVLATWRRAAPEFDLYSSGAATPDGAPRRPRA